MEQLLYVRLYPQFLSIGELEEQSERNVVVPYTRRCYHSFESYRSVRIKVGELADIQNFHLSVDFPKSQILASMEF